MLELNYKFIKKFCDDDKYEELELHTHSLYLVPSEEQVEDIILPEKRDEWNAMRLGDCRDTFTANATDNFFPRMYCKTHKKHKKREPVLFREDLGCIEMLCLCGKKYCCYDRKSNKYKFSSKGPNKRALEDCGDGPMPKYRKVLVESVNETSTNSRF